MNISKGTLIRTIVLFVALLNSILYIFGVDPLPVNEEQVEGTVNAIYTAFTAVLLIGSTIAAWWKNNSFTNAAKDADEHLKRLKKK